MNLLSHWLFPERERYWTQILYTGAGGARPAKLNPEIEVSEHPNVNSGYHYLLNFSHGPFDSTYAFSS